MRNDYDWDYEFLLDWIEFKLKRMANYFSTHNYVENEEKYAKQIQVCLNILYAGYKTDIVTLTDLGDRYVNTRNIHRFYNPKHLETLLNPKFKKYYLPSIREQKAIALFWKYLAHYIGRWWD